MDEKIDHAIEVLVGRIVPAIKAEEAIKYTQAAVNLAHLEEVLNVVKTRKAGHGTG